MDDIKTKTTKIISDILKKIKQHLININTSIILNSQENIKKEQNKLIKYHNYLNIVTCTKDSSPYPWILGGGELQSNSVNITVDKNFKSTVIDKVNTINFDWDIQDNIALDFGHVQIASAILDSGDLIPGQTQVTRMIDLMCKKYSSKSIVYRK